MVSCIEFGLIEDIQQRVADEREEMLIGDDMTWKCILFQLQYQSYTILDIQLVLLE